MRKSPPDLSHRRYRDADGDLLPATMPTAEKPAFAATVLVVCILGAVAVVAWSVVAVWLWRALA